jgi:hypothetical protein
MDAYEAVTTPTGAQVHRPRDPEGSAGARAVRRELGAVWIEYTAV